MKLLTLKIRIGEKEMKKFFIILCMLVSTGLTVAAQDTEETDDRGGKLQQRMKEYIQKRLGLSRNESEKFSPIFLRYIMELRKTHRDNRHDKPLMQLRVAELRIRFRNEFKQIMDEQRANKVYEYQREFENKVREEIKERRLDKNPIRRNQVLY
jgi:hypothetical protein